MRVICIGRMRAGPEADLCARYMARLRPAPKLAELPDGHGAPAETKRREGDALLAALLPGEIAVALDQGGKPLASPEFAQSLQSWRAQGRGIAFLIGGAEGLHEAVLARADHVLSLGQLTWPHLLVRAMLLEQLYRAQCIIQGHPYHRSARPGQQG